FSKYTAFETIAKSFGIKISLAAENVFNGVDKTSTEMRMMLKSLFIFFQNNEKVVSFLDIDE
ncbi:MAG: hypothetical protein GX928_06795, partial [Ruminococcaceae bacterium]|nr:hypothetical protein [Oscillospiraceae bacterium]